MPVKLFAHAHRGTGHPSPPNARKPGSGKETP